MLLNTYVPSVLSAARSDIPSRAGRSDGRSDGEIRGLSCCIGAVGGASGSAFVKYGDTKAICSVHGPRQGSEGQGVDDRALLECDVRYAPYASDGASSMPKSSDKWRSIHTEEKNMSNMMKVSLEASILLQQYPKSIISLHVMIMQSSKDSSATDLAACIIAGSLAISDAAIETNDLVSSCTVALVDERAVVDPTCSELQRAQGYIRIDGMASIDAITQLWMHGRLDPLDVAELLKIGVSGCAFVRGIMRGCLLENK